MRKLTAILLFAGLLPLSPANAGQDEDFQEAFVAYKSGHYDEALQRVDSLLVANPPLPRALELKGRILHATGKYSQAQDFYFMALERDPKLVSCHYYLGEAAFRQKSWGEAIQYYHVHLKEGGPNPKTVLKIIYCAIAGGNLAEASEWMTALSPNDELYPCYYFARAAMAYSSGRIQENADALRQARTLYGNDGYAEFEPDYLFAIKALPDPSIKPAEPAKKKP